ncbi:YHYH domain-containing protein [Neobacillus novalis]|uniref:YHYH domain-containing protein n=2 Tax=Neobacillus novalis TaxID=220687 RepID=A0AA95S8B4_9BACI|nr:YHYH domain-containing protein [Neobacillus novalis]WHY85635.1 YHYH domain-containing protein [Neobacillus novalis]
MREKVLFLFIMFTLVLGSSVDAHSGRTDSNGGHNCSEKSKVKGLCTGYHYHNGGSSSGGSSTGGSSTKASSSGGSTQTVPAAKPAGPSQEQIAQQEKVKGEKDGYAAGTTAGYKGSNENSSAIGTEAYTSGYMAGYQKGLEEGRQKLETEKRAAFDSGYTAGKNGATEEVPIVYSANPLVKGAYEDGFNKAVAEIDEMKKREYFTIGYEEGKKDIINVPKDVKDLYIQAYEEGYNKSQEELKNTYSKKGYDAALMMLKYKEPQLENQKFIDWYKEGFDSNKGVKKIQDEAYALGVSGKDYYLPEKYANAEVLFSHHYKLGAKQYTQNKKDNTTKAAGGVGVVALGWLARRFFVAKKTIS